MFEQSNSGRSAGEQLLILTQNTNTAADYTLAFCTLAAQTKWIEDTLKLLYHHGLSQELQTEMACRDEGRSLNEFMELTIQINATKLTDNLMCSRRPAHPTSTSTSLSSTSPEPMQLGYTHLSPEERERRVQRHLCMYCSQSGHDKSSCPV